MAIWCITGNCDCNRKNVQVYIRIVGKGITPTQRVFSGLQLSYNCEDVGYSCTTVDCQPHFRMSV